MNYQDFLTTIKTQLSSRIAEDVTLDIRSFPRNNGTHYDGLVIWCPTRNVSPTIYLTPYYHRYLDGVSLDDIYEDILATYRKHLPTKDFDTTLFTDFGKAGSRIVMRLVSQRHNEELLEQVPHFHYQDLAIIFYCMIHADHNNQANILIHNDHLSMWGVSADTLYRKACLNTPKLLPAELIPMQAILEQYPPFAEQVSKEDTIPMYILTNRHRTNGATVLLYEGLLARLSEHFQKDLIIIPSSIHELLLVPVDSAQSSENAQYNETVQEVNETQLADEEILSDHIYYYCRSTQLLSM